MAPEATPHTVAKRGEGIAALGCVAWVSLFLDVPLAWSWFFGTGQDGRTPDQVMFWAIAVTAILWGAFVMLVLARVANRV